MCDSSSTHVESGPVVWVGIKAVGFAVAKSGSWSVCGGGGGGGWRGGAGSGFSGGG